MTETNIVLITGGNTGLGFETVKALFASSSPYTILMCSRSLSKAKSAISTLKSSNTTSKSSIIPVQLDIEDDQSIQDAFDEVKAKYSKIDTLINNAGGSFDSLMRTDTSPSAIRAAWNKSYSVNVTSTQVLTTTFMPLLLASSSPRLLFVTSGLGSLTTASEGRISATIREPSKPGWPKPFSPSQIAYRSSKTALNMMMLDWTRQLEPDGVKVFGISPGFLATGLGGMGPEFMRKIGAQEPHLGGEFIRDVVEGKRDGDAGKVVDKDGVQPW
jgi:NAD(P)-dependent dehydrogenase (short-subunit alcohol dehydrogenase family)